jgi:antagonist of KipI
MTVEVIKPGLLTTLQDAGRPGLAHLGIGRAGAFDAPALRIANALCGNPRDTCALEITLLGPTLRFHRDAWIAITGAPLPLRIAGADRPTWSPVFVATGATVELGAMRSGYRSYLAVGGGFAVGPVLGSRSQDINAALGPMDGRPLRAGDLLPFAESRNAAHGVTAAPKWQIDPRPWFAPDVDAPLRLLSASHVDALTTLSHKLLFSDAFKVLPESNRVGIRLAGPVLESTTPIEMVSEGCIPGLLQLPPSGQPVAFGPECPVSGGYPRIGQIAAVDVPRLAQRRPGDALRFTPCTFDDALRALRKRERALTRLETGITARLSA